VQHLGDHADGRDAVVAGNVRPRFAFCFANGKHARQRKLDTGLIEVQNVRDFVLMIRHSTAPAKICSNRAKLAKLAGGAYGD